MKVLNNKSRVNCIVVSEKVYVGLADGTVNVWDKEVVKIQFLGIK